MFSELPLREILIAICVFQFLFGWALVVVHRRLTKHDADRRECPSQDIELQPRRLLPMIDQVETSDLYAVLPSIEDGDNRLREG
jgi:hypothetical protein